MERKERNKTKKAKKRTTTKNHFYHEMSTRLDNLNNRMEVMNLRLGYIKANLIGEEMSTPEYNFTNSLKDFMTLVVISILLLIIFG